jgi:predicted permease
MTVVPREQLGEAFLIMAWVGGTPIWLMLLVVCANVSSLLVARAIMRRGEVAVRFSMGASRARIVRQLLTESILLALLASGAGLVLLVWATTYFETRFPVQLDLDIHWRTVAFTIAFAAGVGVLFGVMPALHAARTSVFDALKGIRGLDRRASRLQRRFVVAQLTLSLPLLAAAGWYVAGASQARGLNGFDAPDRALGVTLDLYLRKYSDPEADALLTAARERIAALPGVQSAAFASNVPFFPRSSYGLYFRLPTAANLQDVRERIGSEASIVDPEYFQAMRIPIRRGRAIEPTDHAGAPLVGVVSEAFAREAWPGIDPIGKTLLTTIRRDTARVDLTFTVVGVGAPVGLRSGEDKPVVFVSRKQVPRPEAITLLVRTLGPAVDMLPVIRRELERLDPQLPLRQLETFERRFAAEFDIDRKIAGISLLAGLLILLIASVGVYASIAFNVAQRVREIGIRIALGAHATQVTRSFVRQGIRLALIGLAVGVPAALLLRLAFTRLLYSLDTGVNALALLAVAGLLLGVVALASWLPARRAATVDPVNTLRTD